MKSYYKGLHTLKVYLLTIFIIIFINQNAVSLDNESASKIKVVNFFDNLKTIEADFIQVSPSGNISNGKLFLDLPGKLRIDYKKPSNLLITCQGFFVIIQNRKLKTTNNIPLSQTPFSILLNDNINFKNKNLLLDLKNSLGIITLRIKIAKRPKIGELVLEFSEKPFILRKWIIKDIVGDKTTVLIQNVKYNQNLSFKIFFPDDMPEKEN